MNSMDAKPPATIWRNPRYAILILLSFALLALAPPAWSQVVTFDEDGRAPGALDSQGPRSVILTWTASYTPSNFSPALTRNDLGVADPSDAANPIRGLEIVGESLSTLTGQGQFAPVSLQVEDFFVPGSAPTDGLDAMAADTGIRSEIRVRALVSPNVFGYAYAGTIAIVRYMDANNNGQIDSDMDLDGVLDTNGPERFVDTDDQQVMRISVEAVNDAPVVVGARSTPSSIAEGSLITGTGDDTTVSMVVTVAAHGSDGNLRDGSPSERQNLTLTVGGLVTQGIADYTVRIEGPDITNRVLLTLGTVAGSGTVELDADGVISSGEVFLSYWTEGADARAAITLTPNDGTVAGAPFSFDVAPRPYLDVSTEDATITREHTVPSDILARNLTVATGLRLPAGSGAVTARFVGGTPSSQGFLLFDSREPVRYRNGNIILMNVHRVADTFGDLMSNIMITGTIELDTGTGDDAAFFRFGRVTLNLEPDAEQITPTVVSLFVSVPPGASGERTMTIATVSLEPPGEAADSQALLNASIAAPPEAELADLFTAGPSIVGGEFATNERFIRVQYTPNMASTQGGLWTATVVQSFVVTDDSNVMTTVTATIGVLSIALEREGYALPEVDLRTPRATFAADLNSATITLEQVRPLRNGVEYTAYVRRNDGSRMGIDEHNSTMSVTRVEGTRADIEFTFTRASHIPFFAPRSPYRFVAIAKHGEQASTQSIVVTAPAGRSTDGVYYDVALCTGTGPDHDNDGVPSGIEAELGTDCNNDDSSFVGPSSINLDSVLAAEVEYRAGVSRALPLTELCVDSSCGGLVLTVWTNCPTMNPSIFDPDLDSADRTDYPAVNACGGPANPPRPANAGGWVYMDTDSEFYIVGRDRMGNWAAAPRFYAASMGETRFNTTVMSFLPGATDTAGSRAEIEMTYLAGRNEEVSVTLRVPSDGDETNPEPRDYEYSFDGDTTPDCEGAWCNYETVITADAATLETVAIQAWDGDPATVGAPAVGLIVSDDMATTPTEVIIASVTISEFATGALLSGDYLSSVDVVAETETEYEVTVFNPSASTNTAAIAAQYRYVSLSFSVGVEEIPNSSPVETREVTTTMSETVTTEVVSAEIEFMPTDARDTAVIRITAPELDTGTFPVTLSIGVRSGSRLIQEWRHTLVLAESAAASGLGTNVMALRGTTRPGIWPRQDWTSGSVSYHVPFTTAVNLAGQSPGDATLHLPEVFDYRVIDLPLGERQAHIVIELPTGTGDRRYSAIKYRPGLRWMNFMVRGGDNVFWARRSPMTGACPPASLDAGTSQSSWYVGGRGYEECVMLRVTDGGPNDDDDVSGANRIIVDPVAFRDVGEALAPGEFLPRAAGSSGGGGGSVSALWLMLLGLLLALSCAFRASRHARVR